MQSYQSIDGRLRTIIALAFMTYIADLDAYECQGGDELSSTTLSMDARFCIIHMIGDHCYLKYIYILYVNDYI